MTEFEREVKDIQKWFFVRHPGVTVNQATTKIISAHKKEVLKLVGEDRREPSNEEITDDILFDGGTGLGEHSRGYNLRAEEIRKRIGEGEA